MPPPLKTLNGIIVYVQFAVWNTLFLCAFKHMSWGKKFCCHRQNQYINNNYNVLYYIWDF